MKALGTALPAIPSARPAEGSASLLEGRPPLPQPQVQSQALTQSLPVITRTPSTQPAIAHTQRVVPEPAFVVQTSSALIAPPSEEEDEQELPVSWVQKQLEFDDHVQRSKVGWENEIARHILSLYASTTARKNIKESNALLDFVGEKDHDLHPQHHYHHDIHTKVPTFESTRPSEPKPTHLEHQASATSLRSSLGAVEEGNEDEPALEDNTDVKVAKGAKGTKGKKNKKKKQKQLSGRAQPGGLPASPSPHEDSEKSHMISVILSKIDHYADISEKKDLYRITNTIRTRDGQEIVVRGTPRCFPIWFTSTGDVFADWTALPGKRHLQAHLSTLYEHEFFKEYLQILEVIIVELFRLNQYGPQEFSLTSFGLSSRTDDLAASKRKTVAPGAATSSSSAAASNKASSAQHSAEGQQRWIDGVLREQLSPNVQVEINRYIPFQRQLGNVDYEAAEVDDQGNPAPAAQTDLSLDEIVGMYEQFILTTLAIAVLCIEKKKFEQALNFLNSAERCANNSEIFSNPRVRKYYKGYVNDTMAYYFFRRKKLLAAKEYSQRAMEVFEKVGDYEGVGACLLHIAAVESSLSKFKEAHKILYQFLAMVEGGRLSASSASPKQLCMVSVAYHNLAVIQLKLDCPDLACKNSQNARKIARLCLSYSNRYIDTYQYTHQVALSDMKHDLSSRTAGEFTKEQLHMIQQLCEALFAVDADVLRQSGESSSLPL